jgi:hypothetical protein
VQQAQTGEQQRNEQKQQSKTGDGRTVPSLQPAAPAAKVSAQNQQHTQPLPTPARDKEPSKWLPNTLSDLVGVLTLFVTAWFLYYTIKTWKEMVRANDNAEKSNEENDRNTAESLRLTRESNEATLSSMLIAKSQRDTLANALRAWVVLRTVQPWNHKTNKPSRIRVELQNTGFSPAIGVHPHGTMSLAESVDYLDHEDSPPGEHTHEPLSVGFVGAGNLTKLEVTGLELTADQKKAVENGELLIYTHGFVDYMDAFGTQRRTSWAALYEPGKAYWTTASRHNSQT